MIRTPLSTVVGGAFWTPEATIVGGTRPSFETVMKKLFANGEQGFFYDPNDLSTMYQDAAGTTPVTAAGQPVGLILDKSGRNNHAYQTVSASRPILQRNATTGAYYLAFDGVDDFLQTANIDFTSTDKVSLFTGVTKLADAGKIIAELSPNTTVNAGSFFFVSGTYGGGNGYSSLARGSANADESQTALNFTYLAPDVAVLSVKHDISGDLSSMRRNGVVGINGLADKGTGSFGNYPLFIGRRAGIAFSFTGHLYGFIGIGKLVSDSETIALEKAIAKNTGVTLNV